MRSGDGEHLLKGATGDRDLHVALSVHLRHEADAHAHLDDIRIVADNNQDGKAGHKSVPFLVRNDGGIARVEDLKGKVLATGFSEADYEKLDL